MWVIWFSFVIVATQNNTTGGYNIFTENSTNSVLTDHGPSPLSKNLNNFKITLHGGNIALVSRDKRAAWTNLCVVKEEKLKEKGSLGR